MNSFIFSYGPRVICEAGAAARLANWAPAGTILFVTDATLVACGLAGPAIDSLRQSGRTVVVFDAVESDPSRGTLEAAVAAGREAHASSVIGFGGGSPLDVAKLAAYLIGSGDDLDAIWGVGNTTGSRLPLTLVPTTAGTGSEATPVAIITLPGDEKRGVSSPALLPDHAVLDPTLTVGLPKPITAATGIDAMVHAIEAFTSAHLKNPVSDMLAREALRLLGANIQRACDEPTDLEARSAMLLGAHLAGVAFANAPVAGVHALAYPLGGRFHVPHGLSNALMLPHVIAFNMDAAQADYAELALILEPGLAGQAETLQGKALIETMKRLSNACGLPSQLREVGVRIRDLDQLADDAMLQERLLRNNPRPIERADARALYAAAI